MCIDRSSWQRRPAFTYTNPNSITAAPVQPLMTADAITSSGLQLPEDEVQPGEEGESSWVRGQRSSGTPTPDYRTFGNYREFIISTEQFHLLCSVRHLCSVCKNPLRQTEISDFWAVQVKI